MTDVQVADGSIRRNLEFKAPSPSPDEARSAALALGASAACVLLQLDTYFKVPHGRLKLREIDGSEAQLIHYVRPEESAQRYSQYQVVVLPEPATMKELLVNSLGLRCVVKKRRELYLWNDCRIHLDEVEGLGRFIEFEVLSSEEVSDRERMETLLNAFHLGDVDAITASYSEMLDSR